MKPAYIMQEILNMRFKEVYTRWQVKHLTVEEAADILGVHERTFQRQCRRYEEKAADGLYDARLGKKAHNAAPVDEVMDVLTLFETKYSNFSPAHFFDKWRDNHGGKRSYVWVKKHLQGSGLVKKHKKKGKHRRKRPRKPLPGMMIHQDGSTHEWVLGIKWDLIVTIDDATSEVYSAFFAEEEGTWSSFKGIQETIEAKGLFCSFYTDRGTHYWYTPKAGEKVDKNQLTQFGRAMKQLGITMIPAYSPEARGRSERNFRTLQDRLIKELALHNITDMSKANTFLKKVFIPEYNRRFMVSAEEEGSAFVPWLPSIVSLKDILCIQEQRTVNKDNTVCYKKKCLQIPQDKYRHHYIKAKVNIHEYEDGTIVLFHGPRRLAEYDIQGNLTAPMALEMQHKEYAVG